MNGDASGGLLDLFYLDESGFAPTLPLSYTWARAGTRPIVPYEAPQGRRVNVIGALAPAGPAPRLAFRSRLGKLDGPAFLEFVWRDVAGLPAPPGALPPDYRRARPCVIVLDNYSVHRSQLIKAAVPALAAAGVTFFYLPPYSPELNAIEPLWRHVKYEDLPIRSYPTGDGLQAAVDEALTKRADALSQTTITLCEAA